MQKKFSNLKVHTQKSAGTESKNSSNISLVASSFVCDRERRILEYLDENGAGLEIPAKLDAAKAEEVKAMAKKVFSSLSCEGLSRVDLFLKKDGTLLVNEINTIPGMTPTSLLPQAAESAGITFEALLERLLASALEGREE